MHKIFNIAKNSFKRKNIGVMLSKVFLRIKERSLNKQKTDVMAWCNAQAESYEDFAKSLNETLWTETQDACEEIKKEADKKLAVLDMDLGGGGNYPVLYFLTRHLSAKTVVETGVAAGWSSQAILSALKKNKNEGQLYSSDFPYFRYANPEKLVGYVVDEDLKNNWHLFIDGDQNNLPEISQKTGTIDLFHYDSDKSYNGREYALQTLEPQLKKDSVVIFDDIQDNFHFKDYVERNKLKYKIFEFEGKYIGLTAPFL